MERLTHERYNGIKTGYWSAAKKDELIDRLAAYENTGLTPEEIKCRPDPCDDDFQSVLICAEFIMPLVSQLSDTTLGALHRDLDNAMRDSKLGDPRIDAPGWIELLHSVEKEIKRRERA